MISNTLYKEYFNIDPKYYAAVTADLIKTGQVKWNAFFPHESFVKLLEKTHIMLSGKDSRSLWVEGAYGTGKSHAALTIKSLLEASDDEIKSYFNEFGLNDDLCNKLIADKNGGKLITIHRIGSASIRSDQDLVLAIQDSVSAALKEHNIDNKGESSLKEAALKWFNEKEANRTYFDSLIHEDKYIWDFGGKSVQQIIEILDKNEDDATVSKIMRSILNVAEDNGITALRLDVSAMCKWIKSILENNDISAILFVWDEFTEYFINNPNSLTGFQTLAEISESHPFYFLVVTHESSALIQDKDMRRKILNRFVGDVTIRITMPENMAFRLMAQAMKTTSDPGKLNEWNNAKADLNDSLKTVRDTIINSAKKTATMGQKTVLKDEELRAVFPMHPYAALLLKHMSVAFNANARSMFDFIISNDMVDAKGFKWFINNYGPLTQPNLLTIDMLWDFFTGKDQNGLNEDVRVILDSFNLLKHGSLTPDQERVFKTVLLLEAISQKVSDVELLRPNIQNIDLAFVGGDWAKSKASSIAEGLCKQGILFEKPVGNNLKEYTVANSGGDKAKIDKLKVEIRSSTKTQDLILAADLLSAVQVPPPIKQRYIVESASLANFSSAYSKLNGLNKPNRFKTLITFALNKVEADSLNGAILKAVVQPSNGLFFIESLEAMDDVLFTQYVENMAYSKYYAQNDRQRALGFETQAKKCLSDWKKKVITGAFMIYTPDEKSGSRLADLKALQEKLETINRGIYFDGLEQYNLLDNMFLKGPLAQGAECGINEEQKQAFSSSNSKKSLATALDGAWKVADYWKDPTKQSLSIVKIKKKVEEMIATKFANSSGRISVLSILDALQDPPYGFMPSNVVAFVLGFVLKEYANNNYFWANGSSSDPMSIDKMKTMIANAINQLASPSSKFKEEFIVVMSANQRCFLQCTASSFKISSDQCGSIESARDQMRIKMRNLHFPIWCLKTILKGVNLKTPINIITDVIDSYCGIANTANSNNSSETVLADQIGQLVHDNPTLTEDLQVLFTNDMCLKGMLAYITDYKNGELQTLATQIGDNGAYIDNLKQKFNAEANWVWNTVTANQKISDVILEYKIILESNKTLPKCISLKEVIAGWVDYTNYIRIPYDVLKKQVGDLAPLLEQLCKIKQTNTIYEQNKQVFLDLLIAQRNNLDSFYSNQLNYFKIIAASFIDGLDDNDVMNFCTGISGGQFTKLSTEYYQFISAEIENFKKNLKKKQLKDLWLEKTGKSNPIQWSEDYKTPILCMFDDHNRGEAKEVFNTINTQYADPNAIEKAIKYLSNANFFDKLKDQDARDTCFMKKIVGDYDIMLNDVEEVRNYLSNVIPDKVYYWIDNSIVQNKIKMFAEKKYKLSGCVEAKNVIGKMGADELRRYLNELIEDNLTVGIEILKNK